MNVRINFTFFLERNRCWWILKKFFDFFYFCSPALLNWVPSTKIAAGQGGYCTEFNQKHLEQIAARLNLRHQKIHCAGSTWFGETSLILKLAQETIRFASYIYDHEFDPKIHPEIQVYMNKSSRGEWPDWWRPVSLLYGQELALNHVIDNLSESWLIKVAVPKNHHYLSTDGFS